MKNLFKNYLLYFILFSLSISCEFLSNKEECNTYAMSPAIDYGDEYTLDRDFKGKLKRFDIILFDYREDEFSHTDGFFSDPRRISRLIGFPGDTIEIIDGKLYVNNIFIEESFMVDSNKTSDSFEKTILYKYEENKIDERDKELIVLERQILIGRNEYFVMVDRRTLINDDESFGSQYTKPYDSRKMGSISELYIEGIVRNIKHSEK